MNPWHSITVCFLYARLRSSGAWHLLRCSLGAALVVLMSGCSWLWPSPPQPEPEREAVQYSDAPLPPPEPRKVIAPEPPPPSPPPPSQRKTARDQVTILPKKDGSIGGVVVRTDGVVVLLNKAYATALVEGPGMVTESTYDAELAKQDFADVLAAFPGEPAKFLLYFLEGKDELTLESDEEIEKIFADLAMRPAPEILVIGHTDAVGAGQYNDKLSLQRAERVRAELVRRGIPEDSITVAGRGKREPLVLTADGVAEPKNRRVEINVR
ncbi:MAG: OmpA family protein [Betaproteobacteria bacterium]|nr:OmpA family protein [Betaproteobacteria bacterium]